MERLDVLLERHNKTRKIRTRTANITYEAMWDLVKLKIITFNLNHGKMAIKVFQKPNVS